MPTLQLTDKFLKSKDCKCPDSKRYELYRDSVIHGLVLRVGAAGKKAWLIDTRNADQKKVQNVFANAAGPGSLNVRQARQKAEELIEKLNASTAGAEKVTLLKVTLLKVTLLTALDHYIRSKHSPETTKKSMKETLTLYGKPIADVDIRKITKEQALATVEAAWARSVSQGNLFSGSLLR